MFTKHVLGNKASFVMGSSLCQAAGVWYQASHLSYQSHSAELERVRVCVKDTTLASLCTQTEGNFCPMRRKKGETVRQRAEDAELSHWTLLKQLWLENK